MKNALSHIFKNTSTQRKKNLTALQSKPIIIYGAGSVGQDLFRLFVRKGLQVACFMDQKAQQGDTWEGVPLLHPEDASIVRSSRKQYCVVIGIFNAFVEIPPILKKLRSLGYEDIISFVDLYEEFALDLGERFWLAPRSFYEKNEPLIRSAYEVWADEKSRALYASIFKFRLTGDYSVLPTPDPEGQYFPSDIPVVETPVRFVDCGAYNGDTIDQLISRNIQVEAIAAFEPEEENIRLLSRYIQSNKKSLPDTVCVFPCGVHSITTTMKFVAGRGAGSGFSESGNSSIQCTSLDEALPKFNPTFIKMDIEGSEYAALLGARRIIKEHNPRLAVCVYHRPEHVWQIPLLIKQMNPRGKMYLRSHNYSGFDLVMYYIPA